MNTTFDINLATYQSGNLKKDILEAKINTLVMYVNRLIKKHFKSKNPNVAYGYKPNSVEYEMWKLKHYGSLPQLVLSGELASAVQNGRVLKNGKISFDLPKYGLYQLQDGRDFLSPNAKDLKEMEAYFKKELVRIRKKRINTSRRPRIRGK
jgi:hypothetical protein